MKRNLILLGIILLLGGVIYYGMQRSNAKNKYADLTADRAFNVEDPETIHQIKISRRTRKPVLLEKKDGIWYVGEKRANQHMVNNMLQVIRLARIKFIPPNQAVKNIIREVNQVGIQIDLYDKSAELFKSFFVGGNTHDEEGTYFLMQGSIQPYVMERPFVKGGLRDIFLHEEFELWDLYYMLEKGENIKSITVDYPKDKKNAFHVERVGDKEFSLEPVYPTTVKIPRKLNNNTIEAYFSEFEKLSSEAYENDNPRLEEIKAAIPFAIFTITLNDGTEKVLKYYPVLDFLQGSITLGQLEMINLKHIERFFMDSNWGDTYLVQKRLCKEIFKGYNYFFR